MKFKELMESNNKQVEYEMRTELLKRYNFITKKDAFKFWQNLNYPQKLMLKVYNSIEWDYLENED